MNKAEKWQSEGHKPQHIRARVANRMTRGVFELVAGCQIHQYASQQDRGYVMDKLLTFHRDHETSPAVIVSDLKTRLISFRSHARMNRQSFRKSR